MILIDTDILIDISRRLPPALSWVATLGTEQLAVPGFAAMELVQGCSNKASLQTAEQELARFDVVWPSSPACDAALRTFAAYHLSQSLGIIDSLVGHTAVELALPLHTFNVKHFSVVPGLQTVQPYARQVL